MLMHMRTTIELSTAILHRAKCLAKARNTSVKALIEDGLRKIFEESEKAPPFTLKDGAYGKGGLVQGLDHTDWDLIRDRLYEGRGS